MATILVIEDDAMVRKFIVEALTNSGHHVLEADHGHAAAETVREHVVQLVITDIIMPEKDGLEVILELRQVFPSLKVIAISGGGLGDPTSYLRSASMLGADCVLAKPFSCSELLLAVDQMLYDT